MSNIRKFQIKDDFVEDSIKNGVWQTIGRGEFSIENGLLIVKDGYVITGDVEWRDYSLKVKARTPQTNSQVQIWVGVRHYNRDYRYVIALRGGNNNHLYLARYGAEGYDKMLALEPLDFLPVPGQWYTIKVIVAGHKIAVYLNNEEIPRIVAEDNNAPFEKGKVSLGGSYLSTEFDHIEINSVSRDVLTNVDKKSVDLVQLASLKELKKEDHRQKYQPFTFPKLLADRMEISLDGDWLFLPDYQVDEDPIAISYDDSHWHLMDVPNFWIPLQCWLEGERFENGKFNKGQNDTFHQLEEERCESYTFDFEKTQSAWYRHYLSDLPVDASEKKIIIYFEGVALISEIYFNGIKLHENIGMFGPFEVDISNYIKPDNNVVVLHVWRNWDKSTSESISSDTINANYAAAWDILEGVEKGDDKKLESFQTRENIEDLPHGFYGDSPGGIWKPVKLIITDKVKLEDFFFVPTLESAMIDVWYSNNTRLVQPIELSYQIKDNSSGNILCSSLIESRKLKPETIQKTNFTTPKVEPRLWAPGSPNLYTFTLSIKRGDQVLDTLSKKVGFRTVEVKGNKILFNGKPLWIRGANHMPGHIKPYDKALAKKFMQLALSHNVIATRTHCSPFSQSWMEAADEAGVMVSYEGTWPWLMLDGENPPSDESIQIWKNDFAKLIKANRNHPSIFLWTINNEMKFYFHSQEDVAEKKWRVLTDAIKMVRNLDSSLPIIADSAYYRKFLVKRKKYENNVVANKWDDGDIDDAHAYFNWYEESFFNFFGGKFNHNFCTPGRPLISQELSTGYPRAEDGLPTRQYLFSHQTPQTLVGKDAYEHADPQYFQVRHAMGTKELIEMFRRVEHDNVAGIMPFAFETWFYHHHDHNKVSPMLTAKKLKIAFQPVVASVELYGRHYFAGSTISTKLTLINDSMDKQKLPETQVICHIKYSGNILSSQSFNFKSIDYYQTAMQEILLELPKDLPKPRINVNLALNVEVNNTLISQNEYDLVLAEKSWSVNTEDQEKRTFYILEEDKDASSLTEFYGLKVIKIPEILNLNDVKSEMELNTLILGKMQNDITANYNIIKDFATQGGKVVILNKIRAISKLLPDIGLKFKKWRHEITTMNIKESPVFDEIEPLDIAWFTDSTNVPFVATGRYAVDRFNPNVRVLAEALQFHGYMAKPEHYRRIGGTPLLEVRVGKGLIRLSQMRYDAIEFDPIAARLISNILKN